MKNLLYFDIYSKRRGFELINDNGKRTQLFQKYFPKYLKRFSYISRNGPVASKVKRVKILQDFETSYIHKSSRDWRILLGNKMKSIKVFSGSNKAPFQFPEMIKLFSGLKTVKISMPAYPYLKKEEYFLEKACKPMKRLRKLKCLEISPLTFFCEKFLRKLDSFSKVLSSLKRLDISFEEKAATDPELLEMFLQNSNILKYMTHLNLGTLCSDSHFQSFVSLSKTCPNLLSLAFEFSCRDVEYNYFGLKHFASSCFEVKTDYLQGIRNLQKLEALNLNIADTLTFLRDFALPPSVQSLRLNFEESLSKEILKKLDHNFKNFSVFEENKTLLKFYQNFQQLHGLDTLEVVETLEFGAVTHYYQSYLSQCFMKRLTSVQTLSYKFSPGFMHLVSNYWTTNEDINFARYFASCRHLGNSLEILEIGHEKITFPKVDLSAFHGKFVNLSSIKINGKFYESDQINDKIGPLLKQMGSLGDNIKIIKLCTFVDNIVEPLFNLLRQVNRLNLLGKMKIGLQIKFSGKQSLEDLRNGSIVAMNDLKKAKGVSLKLWTKIKSENVREFLRAYGEKFDSFEVIQKNVY